MKKNLLITVNENDATGYVSVTINGTTTPVTEDGHRQLWALLKGGTSPKCALSFIPPNHENAIRIVKDFRFETVRKFVADVLDTSEDFIKLLYNDGSQTLVKVDDEEGEYTYRIDHTKIM